MADFFPIDINAFSKPLTVSNSLYHQITNYFDLIYNDSSDYDNFRSGTEIPFLTHELLLSKVTKEIPHNPPIFLQNLVLANINELGLLFQYSFVRGFDIMPMITSMTASYGSPIGNSVSVERALTKIKATSNQTYSATHIQTVLDTFFKDVPQEQLEIATVNFDSEASMSSFFSNFSSKSSSLCFPVTWNTAVSKLNKNVFYVGGHKHSISYTMTTHPFVFAMNCLFLHKKVFILSFDTESHITFIWRTAPTHNAEPPMDFASFFPHIPKILSKELTIEDYIATFTKDYERLFQREKMETATLLSSLNLHSQKMVTAMIYTMWNQFVQSKITNFVSNQMKLIDSPQEQPIDVNNSFSTFGWS